MERSKEYDRVCFGATSLQRIVSEFKDIVVDTETTRFVYLSIHRGKESWRYDTIDEFLAEINGEFRLAKLVIENPELSLEITLWPPDSHMNTSVTIASRRRELIIRLGNVVDSCAKDCYVPLPPRIEPPPPKPKIFIGHGGSPQWRDLKDHLHEFHGYEVLAYETGSRAGHTIRDVVAEMLKMSSFAILVMTGEDVQSDGSVRARQNVIHEIGLFQGRLGFTKAIVLKEDGTEEFSNIHGVSQVRYTRGNIKETFGEVVAVLRREFGGDS